MSRKLGQGDIEFDQFQDSFVYGHVRRKNKIRGYTLFEFIGKLFRNTSVFVPSLMAIQNVKPTSSVLHSSRSLTNFIHQRDRAGANSLVRTVKSYGLGSNHVDLALLLKETGGPILNTFVFNLSGK